MTGNAAHPETLDDAPEPTKPVGNVHARKLAVMKRCGDIVPDKEHPHHHFKYVSIQTLSKHLREFMVDAGLDFEVTCDEGWIRLSLINADDPQDRIETAWPIVAGDKGFAYTVKYPLMRLFLVGDEDEADEAEMASASGQTTATAPPAAAAAPAPQRVATKDYEDLGECFICSSQNIQSRQGKMPHLYRRGNRPAQCNGYLGQGDGGVDRYANHTQADIDAFRAALDAGDVDPDSIPF